MITIPCHSIEVTLCGEGGTIKSHLHSPEEEGETDTWDSAVDALECLILAHACAGVDVTAPAYVKGIETAVLVLETHLP